MSDQYQAGGDAVDYPEYDEQQFGGHEHAVSPETIEMAAQAIAQRAEEHFAQSQDPFDRALVEREDEQHAELARRANEFVAKYPEVNDPAVAQQVISDARRSRMSSAIWNARATSISGRRSTRRARPARARRR